MEFNEKVNNFESVKVDSEIKNRLQELKLKLKCKNITSVLIRLVQISQTKVKITKGGFEETIEIIFLPERLRNNWILKGIDTRYLASLA